MRAFEVLKKNKKPVIIIIVVAVIIIALTLIYYLNYSSKSNSPTLSTSNSTPGSDLKGYPELMQNVNSLRSDNTLAQAPLFSRIINSLQIVGNSKSTEQERYNALVNADGLLENLYNTTNNHKLYSIPGDFSDFAKINFPKLYKDSDFFPVYCIDPSCAQSPQPQAILNIVNEIKNSNVPEVVKTTFVQDILNPGYLQNSFLNTKIFAYTIVANNLKNSGALTKAGLNEKLYNELTDYVKTTYPEEYNKIMSK
ncbi:hypothetical protein M1615_02590 [Patescibacteria group bacterium]|nr:hypothetical protein [Patescibacteria group bacterium]